MNKSKNLSFALLIESLFLFCTSGAYFFWFSKVSILFSLGAVLFPLMVSFVSFKKIDDKRLFIVILFSMAFILHSIVIKGSLVYTLVLAIIPFFLFVPSSFRASIIDNYILIVFPVLLSVSVATYLLEGFNIIHLPVFPVQPINEGKTYFYISHIFFLQDSTSIAVFDRFNSYYEECGVIGSMIALFLFSHGERMPLGTKIVYILSGFLTFSLFFFALFILYLIISLREKKRVFIGGLVITVAIGYLLFYTFDSEFIDVYITNRFNIENREWINDRETESFMSFFWNDFIHSDDVFFGTSRVKSEGWSIFRCVVENGIIVVLSTVFLYMSCILRNRNNKNRWIYLMVFLAMFYQRPEFWSIFYFIFFSTISETSSGTESLAYDGNRNIIISPN